MARFAKQDAMDMLSYSSSTSFQSFRAADQQPQHLHQPDIQQHEHA
jgi:hypothetical protein